MICVLLKGYRQHLGKSRHKRRFQRPNGPRHLNPPAVNRTHTFSTSKGTTSQPQLMANRSTPTQPLTLISNPLNPNSTLNPRFRASDMGYEVVETSFLTKSPASTSGSPHTPLLNSQESRILNMFMYATDRRKPCRLWDPRHPKTATRGTGLSTCRIATTTGSAESWTENTRKVDSCFILWFCFALCVGFVLCLRCFVFRVCVYGKH